jgi:hypothetical protein
MYYHLNEHIYITQFGDECILLDTRKDKYIIYLTPFSQLVFEILEKDLTDIKYQSTPSKKKDSQVLAITEKFLASNYFIEKEVPYPFYIDKKPASVGVANVDWSLPLTNKTLKFNFSVFNALFVLLKVNFFMKTKGLHFVIQMIKSSKKDNTHYSIPQEKDLENLANILNKACFIYPTRTKCLEWAMSFILLALQRKWKCNLEIGVQNYPFSAHAWVECNGRVVMDSQDLRQGMAIILNEPFRKLKN